MPPDRGAVVADVHLPPPSPLAIEEITRVSDLAAHAAEWRDLAERLPEPSLYNTWEWTSAKLESFWPTRPVAVLLVRREGELVGAAPLVVDRAEDVWCQGSLTVPEERVGFLCASPAAEVLDAVLAHVDTTRRHWRLGLPRCPEDSPLVAAALPAVARARGLQTFVRPAEPSRLVLNREGWSGATSGRGRGTSGTSGAGSGGSWRRRGESRCEG